MSFNRIPFGFKPADGTFVDVAEVTRGAKCGCICPSCKTPLIARHCESDRVWHFAHDWRGVYKETQKECDFSFYLSVRMMARQIISDQLSVSLPAYCGEVINKTSIYSKTFSEKFTVTKSRDITLINVRVENRFLGMDVDVIGEVQGYKFVIYFTHPGRAIPFQPDSFEGEKCGVITISLEPLQNLFSKCRKQKISYQQLLSEFIQSDLTSKSWFYHPLFEKKRRQAKARLDERLQPKPIISPPITAPQKVEFRGERNKMLRTKNHVLFRCEKCDREWQGQIPGINACPDCRSTQHRKQISS